MQIEQQPFIRYEENQAAHLSACLLFTSILENIHA